MAKKFSKGCRSWLVLGTFTMTCWAAHAQLLVLVYRAPNMHESPPGLLQPRRVESIIFYCNAA